MNTSLAAAGVLCAIGVVWHGVGGERGIVSQLRPDALAPSFFGDGDITKRFLRACWHLFTIHLAACAIVLVLLARAPHGEAHVIITRMIALEFVGFLAVYVALAAGRPVLFVRAPQWAFFVAVAALAWVGGSS